jgi:hypothetical protein
MWITTGGKQSGCCESQLWTTVCAWPSAPHIGGVGLAITVIL